MKVKKIRKIKKLKIECNMKIKKILEELKEFEIQCDGKKIENLEFL